MGGYILQLIAVVCVAGMGYGFFRTWRTSMNPDLAAFRKAPCPPELPQGRWTGFVDELGSLSWKGKDFRAPTGINLFEKQGRMSEAYRFTYYRAKSISGSGQDVLRLDYGQRGNPFWLHFIVDEMVEVRPGSLLGIVYISIIPGTPFRMGFFRLTKGNPPGFLS